MKRILALITLIAAASLVAASTAKAHDTTWFWNTPAAEYELIRQNLYWYDPDNPSDEWTDNVIDADCKGVGRNYRFRDGTRGGFKHFRCTVWTMDDQQYLVFVHVLGKHKFDYKFLRDLSYSPGI